MHLQPLRCTGTLAPSCAAAATPHTPHALADHAAAHCGPLCCSDAGGAGDAGALAAQRAIWSAERALHSSLQQAQQLLSVVVASKGYGHGLEHMVQRQVCSCPTLRRLPQH